MFNNVNIILNNSITVYNGGRAVYLKNNKRIMSKGVICLRVMLRSRKNNKQWGEWIALGENNLIERFREIIEIESGDNQRITEDEFENRIFNFVKYLIENKKLNENLDHPIIKRIVSKYKQ